MIKFVELGNLDAERDWGHAKDYVEAMWLMLQSDKPDDYVVGTGKTNSVRNFAKFAFETLDMDYEKYIKINKIFFRPSEVELLKSDSSKIKKNLGWESKINFFELISEMVKADYDYYKNI